MKNMSRNFKIYECNIKLPQKSYDVKSKLIIIFHLFIFHPVEDRHRGKE